MSKRRSRHASPEPSARPRGHPPEHSHRPRRRERPSDIIPAPARDNDASAQERLVKINHKIPLEFPEDALREAAALATLREQDDAGSREDLRRLDFVTIDGADARDFDDAVHVAPTQDGQDGQGWILHVAIADVSWFVRPGSALDREARERGNSCYFPLSVEPMLPAALSTNLCSLLPGADRFVLAARLRVSAAGAVTDACFMPAVIRSRARLTYEIAQAVLDGAEPETAPSALAPVLRHAAAMARSLRAARMNRGALDMDVPDPAYELDSRNRLTAIRKAGALFAHKLIEECMLAANEAVARFLDGKNLPFPFRVHPAPDADRLESLFQTLIHASLPPEMLRHVPARSGEASAYAIKPLLDAARGTPQAFLVNRLVLRSMMQARYSPERAGHFGLASECYCHFTSPIRRYADLATHRALRLALGRGVGPIPARHKLLAVTEQCNARERAALEAERETARRMACLLLAGREGEVFAGIIASVVDFGFFVELADMPVEGLVPLSSLRDDWYGRDPKRQELVGVRHGRVFRLGQNVRVRLARVDPYRLEIDLDLPENGSRPQKTTRNGKAGRSRKAGRDKTRPPSSNGPKGRKGRKKSSSPFSPAARPEPRPPRARSL
jgi:ribonuclease R